MASLSLFPDTGIRHYKIHILVFLIALIAALTIAHPSIFVTDEWVTVNQLAQISEGHQLIINEGKYGTSGNDAAVSLPSHQKYYLAYPLFLPAISLPALWLVNGIDRFFIYFMINLWTFLLIALALFMNAYFPEYARIGKYRWTSGLIVAAFLLFFLNLFFYRPFPVTGSEAYPEVMAVVLTSMILFCLIAVMIYEINRSVFNDIPYAVFGSLVCVSCSSYLFWANYCKDHVLVAFLVVLLTLLVVKYLSAGNMNCLYGAFGMAGLLAWARPELALFVFMCLGIFLIYLIAVHRAEFTPIKKVLPLIIAPFFTLAGAIPFFINNYLFTGNFFIPAWILWDQSSSPAGVAVPGTGIVRQASSDTIGSLTHLFMSTTHFQPATVIPDLYGVLFNPQSGSLGVFPVVPLFLIAVFLVPVYWIFGKWQVSLEEKHLLAAMSLLALGVFLAYVRGLAGMNISVGVVPDMRYLSPMYLPLNIIGLLLIRKLPSVSENPLGIVKGMICSWIIIIPASIVTMMTFYPAPEIFSDLFLPLNILTVLTIYILITLCLIGILGTVSFNLPGRYTRILLALACAVPFIWQVDAGFLVRLFGSGLEGYSFIIPVIRMVLQLQFI